MLERLFTSRTRVKILTLFMMNPGHDFFLREISRLIHENYNSVRRELKNLEDLGLLISKKQGNLKYFSIETHYPIYPELRNIIMKTEGVSNYAKDLLSQVSGVEVAFIYGSFASAEADKGSDLDLFIVGDVNEDELLKKISSLEEMVNREINYFLITTDELKARSKKEDAFLYNVLEGPKIMIIGDLDVG